MKSDDHGQSGPFTIFLLTCRRPEIDFRLPLARELAGVGHEVFYTFLKRRPVVTRFHGAESERLDVSLPALASIMRQRLRGVSRGLVFNSTNLAFPYVTAALRQVTGGRWCLDLHDDLLYEHTGWRRRKAKLAQAVLVQNSDFMVHAAPTLAELFPRSQHLGNASSVGSMVRGAFQTDRVLVLASLDGRFDFAFLANVARSCPAVHFEVHGQVSQNAAATLAQMQQVVAACGNVSYHGAYTNADLPALLQRFSVTLAPYVTASRLTRYIDPLRYYHCLNAGMEVITTDIPTAQALDRHLHRATSPEAVADVLGTLQRDPEARRNAASTVDIFNWTVKARRLMEIASCSAPVGASGHD